MAVTLEEISGWLDQLELKYDMKDEKIVFFLDDDNSTKMHVLKAKEEGCLFEWNMRIVNDEQDGVFKVKEHEYLSTLLAYLLQINYQTKFGTWEYDPKDGEINLNVEIPLEDAKMTFNQFKRICSLTLDTYEFTDNIKKILETGEMPKNQEDELLEMFQAMLAMAKKELEAETEDGI